jgi:hypothetical protein
VREPLSIEAAIDIDLDTLDLRSERRWVTCYIWLPEGYNVADIDPYTIFLQDQIEASWMWFDEEQQVAMAKFGHSELQHILEPGQMQLAVSGILTDRTRFKGTDTITIVGR